MSDEDFNRLFGQRPASQKTFAERIGRADPLGEAQPADTNAGDGVYRPYGSHPTNAIGETCDVRRWMDGTAIAEGIEFSYRLLMQVAYVGQEQLRLFRPDTIVLVEGTMLGDLRQKLARRQATFIQQFSPRIWSRPNQGEPVIERIEIMRPHAMHGSN
jgi:hypothetical protein